MGPMDMGPTDICPSDVGPSDKCPSDVGPSDMCSSDMKTFCVIFIQDAFGDKM